MFSSCPKGWSKAVFIVRASTRKIETTKGLSLKTSAFNAFASKVCNRIQLASTTSESTEPRLPNLIISLINPTELRNEISLGLPRHFRKNARCAGMRVRQSARESRDKKGQGPALIPKPAPLAAIARLQSFAPASFVPSTSCCRFTFGVAWSLHADRILHIFF